MKTKEKIILTVSVIVIMFAMFGLGIVLGTDIGEKRKALIVHVDLADTELTVPNEETKYPFIPKELSDYICALSNELQIDSDLVVAILMRENPEFNPEATHKNDNGTFDCGLFQLNDCYLYSVFIPSYWKMDVEFNVFNWKHNTFLACHLIQDLSVSLKVQDDVIMAYNCGCGAVMNNKIPSSTFNYLASVKNNYSILKEAAKNRGEA